MSLFHLSASTIVGKTIPKNSFDGYVNSKQRQLFTNNISKIRWTNKLSKETTNLTGHHISEIQIFELELKNKEKISEILSVIDRAIPYPILFVIYYKEETMLSISVKHPNPANVDNAVVDWVFATEWLPRDTLPQVISLRDSLDFVFEHICRQVVGEKDEIDLDSLISKERKIKQLRSKIDLLSSQISQCKQFNEKVELNREYQALLEELCKFGN